MKSDAHFALQIKENWTKLKKIDRKYHCSKIPGPIKRQWKLLSKLGETALPTKNYLKVCTIQYTDCLCQITDI